MQYVRNEIIRVKTSIFVYDDRAKSKVSHAIIVLVDDLR